MKKNQKSETNIGSWRLADGDRTTPWRDHPFSEKSEEDQKRTPKKIVISHFHRIRKNWILLPYGMYYNSELLTAQKGDILLFSDRVEREIEYLSPIKAKSGLSDYFCRKTYGIGMKLLKERWKVNIEFEGYNINAVNEDRVMLIFLKELKELEDEGKRKAKKRI